MTGDSYNIQVAEGGYIVYVNRASDQSAAPTTYRPPEPRVFADSSGLINYLHNELAGA